MTIKEFIEKAIEGGWIFKNRVDKNTHFLASFEGEPFKDYILVHERDIFLDPLAWQAVGINEGWSSQIFLFDPEQDEYEEQDF